MKKMKRKLKVRLLYTQTSLSAVIAILCFFQFGNMPGYDLYLFLGWILFLSILGYSLNSLEKIHQSNKLN